MSFDVERLYSLLPAVYRIRDAQIAEQQFGDPSQPGPLKALLAVIAEQTAVLEDNLDQLYDDLFIETCAEWVVPYIGDLVGSRGTQVFPGSSFTERGFVANTIGYRRRKGTAAVLEQLARDVTDWPASVVEYYKLLATTQYMNHIRMDNLAVASLRDSLALEAIKTPFDKIARTADVRRIQPLRGKYNIPNIGIFLYRIGNYPITDAPAFRLDSRRWLFDALGRDTHLFNNPEPETEITHLAEPANVPMPLARRAVDANIDAYYGVDNSFSLVVDGSAIKSSQVKICNLSDDGPNWAHAPIDKIAIDPLLGRIAFPTNQPPPNSVRVNYFYGFSAEMGGGQYARETTFVLNGTPVVVPDDATKIQKALDLSTASDGIVEIRANNYFIEPLLITAGSAHGRLTELRANEEHRPVIVLGFNDSVMVVGGDESEVTLNGLLIVGGSIRIPFLDKKGNPNQLKLLRLRHCTLAPGAIPTINGIAFQNAETRLHVKLPGVTVEIDNCILGPIRAIDSATIKISNSIVDAGHPTEIAYAGLGDSGNAAPLTVENTTIIGQVHTRLMTLASNTIFHSALKKTDTFAAPVTSERLQQGCVRFSYVPPGSRLPKQYQCQPALSGDPARVRPIFTSSRFGDAAYGQLAIQCAVEIQQGADDGSEMGAFHNLYQSQRESNLRASLDEYLRFGLEAGIFLAS